MKAVLGLVLSPLLSGGQTVEHEDVPAQRADSWVQRGGPEFGNHPLGWQENRSVYYVPGSLAYLGLIQAGGTVWNPFLWVLVDRWENWSYVTCSDSYIGLVKEKNILILVTARKTLFRTIGVLWALWSRREIRLNSEYSKDSWQFRAKEPSEGIAPMMY